jgi:fructose-bisphosphate aldolase class II
LGISVEGEIGAIGKKNSTILEGNDISLFTDPDDARLYIESTGIDMLAVSIGNVHGSYTGEPKIDFNLLERICKTVKIPLVLHGGSGISESDLEKMVSFRISKVNIASDLIRTTRSSLMREWGKKPNSWLPESLANAMKELSGVIEKWICYTGADGKT